MHSIARAAVLSLAACLALLATSVPVAAAPKRITGKLSKPGYTVIALTATGEATVVRATVGDFRLTPRARRVTLHLRSPDGTYAGPIVVGRSGTRAIVGVKAGARLGSVRVRTGYGKVSKRLRKKWVDASRRARARKGVPIGAGVFGRVRSRPPRNPPPGDSDVDGVPEPLDIDDDGDLVLDNLDRSTAARTSQAAAGALRVSSDLTLDLPQTVNANAGPLSAEQVDATLSGPGGRIGIGILGASAELDCGGDPNADPSRRGLLYCSRGGTGTLAAPPGGRFPEDHDGDGDGFGTLRPPPSIPPGSGFGAMGLAHGAETRSPEKPATTSQIGTGDQLIEWVNATGDQSQCPPLSATCEPFSATLQYVFATVPALVSYDDDGPGGKEPRTLPYPYPAGFAHDLPVAPRPAGDPFAGDVVLTLTFWRPQRTPIGSGPDREACLDADPPCEWVDIGGLGYSAGLEGPGDSCPQNAFSAPSGDLIPRETGPGIPAGFTDQALDRRADTENKFTYTLNLTQCLASPWNSGELRRFHFVASPPAGGGVAQQIVVFKRE